MQAQFAHRRTLFMLPGLYAAPAWSRCCCSRPPALDAFDALRWFKRFALAKVRPRRPAFGQAGRAVGLRGSQA
eukprot:5468782-Heterocapsa_arctica.AAC.1